MIYPGLIDTGMFKGVIHRFSWVAPQLTSEFVANKIVKVVEQGVGVDLMMPMYVNWIPLIKILPFRVLDWLKDITGGNTDMMRFKQ